MRFYILLGMSLMIGGCSLVSDSQVVMEASPPKRPPKPEYMPAEEKPLDSPAPGKIPVPIAPQVGIRIPLGK